MRNSPFPRWVAQEVFLLTLLNLVTSASYAQTTGGIAGWITDSSGAPLPGVTIQASSASLQGRRAGVTVKNGSYRFPALPPGRYTLRASLSGFASVEKTVTVTADSTSIVKMILQLTLSEQVVVSGEAPLIDPTSTTTGTKYANRLVIHLPVNRNYADIVMGNPGVIPDRGETQGRSLGLSIYGSTSAENQWIIDGVNTTNVMKGVQGKAINNEFVDEVEVKTGAYQAEYGRALGGVINIVTKSGGNTFHGDVFAYYDSAALRATRVFEEGRDSSLSGMRLADYKRTDYGVDLGGFLVKDRLWFFGAYNRVEFPARVSRFASSLLVPDTMEFPLDGTDTLYSVKLTWNPSSGSTFVGTVFSDPTTNSGAGAADPRQGSFVLRPITSPDPGTWQSERSIGGTDYGLRFHQIFGSSLLTLQAARHQDRYELTPTGPGLGVQLADFTCAGGALDAPCQIPAEANFVQGGFGLVGGPGVDSSSHRNQFRADMSLYLGPHAIKVGADYQNARTEARGGYSGGQLVYRLNEYGETYYLHQFSTGGYGTYLNESGFWTPVQQDFAASARELGVYVQDSWRLGPGLTINAGLRWDREELWDSRANPSNGTSQQYDEWFKGVAKIQLTNEWQPRVGMVWDPWRDGATKLYAFAGRFYYSLPTEIAARFFQPSLDARTFNLDPVDVTPDPNVYNHPVPFISGSFAWQMDEPLRGTSLDEFTLGVERLLGPSFSVGLKATYRRLHGAIEDRCDFNYTASADFHDYVGPESNISTCALMNPGSDGRYARGDFPPCTGMAELDNCIDVNTGGDSNVGTAPAPPARRLYRGIELLARKTVADRLWLQLSYTFSSLRGNYDGAVNQSFGGQTSPGMNVDFDYPALFHNAYGRLYLDRPHDLRFQGVYSTSFRLTAGLEAYALSGPPLDKVGYFNQFRGSVIQLVPRGSAGRLPTQWDANLSLEYPVRLGPATVTLQGYLYNVFNNQIPTNQDTVWSNQPPAGYPDTVFDPNQPQSNPNYGKITIRQSPRLFRAAVRVSF